MTDISLMRIRVASQYPMSQKWHLKVRKMPDDQIIALYYRFTEEKIKKEQENANVKQLPLFD